MILFKRKSHRWFPWNFIRKPVWFSICYNFQSFWIYKDSYTLTSPLQLQNLSRATKGETQKSWFHAKQLTPFQIISYWVFFFDVWHIARLFFFAIWQCLRFRINWMYLFLHCNHNICQYFHLHGSHALKLWDEFSICNLDLFQCKMYQSREKTKISIHFLLIFSIWDNTNLEFLNLWLIDKVILFFDIFQAEVSWQSKK